MPIIGASDFGVSQFGRQVTIVSFTFLDKHKINGTITDAGLVELVGTWIPNPVYGDMDYEMRYARYRDFDGIMFPMQIHTHQADPRLNPAHNYFQYDVASVKMNPPVEAMPVWRFRQSVAASDRCLADDPRALPPAAISPR